MSDLSSETRALIDAGRDGDEPTAADRARIRASLLQAIAAGGAGAAATGAAGTAKAATAAASAPWFAAGWKIALATLVIGTASTVAVVQTREQPAAPPPARQVAVVGHEDEPARVSSNPGALPVPSPVGVPQTPPISGPGQGPGLISAENPPVVARAASRALPVVTPDPRPSATASDPPPAPSDPVALANPAAAPQTPPPPDTLPAETRRLQEAHAALKGGDPNKALTLLEENKADGPQLREERAAARVFALCDLRRTDEARAAATKFLADNPRSPLAPRVRASCGGR